MAAGGRTSSDVHFDPFDCAFHEDPYPVYRELREKAPVFWNGELRFWALSRHADVLARGFAAMPISFGRDAVR